MNFPILFAASSIILGTLVREAASGCLEFLGFPPTKECENYTYSVVSKFSDLEKVYDDLRAKAPHYQKDTTFDDKEMKECVCESISSSGYMAIKKEDSSNMGTNYQRISQARIDALFSGNWPSHYQTVLNDYEVRTIWYLGYNFRSTLMEFSGRNEYGFACATKHRETDHIYIYYISDPYPMNITEEEQISVHFICLMSDTSCTLEAMAEPPAITFAYPVYPVEDIYVQIRTFYDRAPKESEDPICGLASALKLHVCTSVMSAPHFARKIQYLPDADRLEPCELKNVSLQTESSKTAEDGEIFQEWMLKCLVKPIDEKSPYAYFVSRAYYAHHAIVYSYHSATKGWRIENISGRIRVIKETNLSNATREKFRESTPPDLATLLKNAHISEIPKASRSKEENSLVNSDKKTT